jgi:hypothetical protein
MPLACVRYRPFMVDCPSELQWMATGVATQSTTLLPQSTCGNRFDFVKKNTNYDLRVIDTPQSPV